METVSQQEQPLVSSRSTEVAPAEKRIRRPSKPREVKWVRATYPPIPVRGLWDQATEEERGQAKRIAVKILESWIGLTTKTDAAKTLEMAPIRFWQMSNQAMAGMMAGVLTQPRVRMKRQENGMTEREEINMLRKMVRELERKVMVQDKLIEILKSMPGCQAVEVKDDDPEESKGGVSRDDERAGRALARKGAKRKSKNNH